MAHPKQGCKMERREFLRLSGGAFAFLSAGGLLAGCSGGDGGGGPLPAPAGGGGVKGSLSLGAETRVADLTIPAAGGTVTVPNTGSPLDGLKVRADANAFPANTVLQLSQRPINSHTYGPLVNPATPLITIDSNIESAQSPLVITIPAKVAADAVPVAVRYDAATGSLAPITVVSHDANSVTVLLSNFAPPPTRASSRTAVFVTTTPSSALPASADSGYRPGTDDFEFLNRGTSITQKGNCTGHSAGSIWYYLFSKRAHGKLNGRSDNNGPPNPPTPNVWPDDVKGIRLVATIQKTYSARWASIFNDLTLNVTGPRPPKQVYESLLLSMALTGYPALLTLGRDDRGFTHAVVAYAVGPGRIHVADPNAPNNATRGVDYRAENFSTFQSGPDFFDSPLFYNKYEVRNLDEMISYSQLAQLFAAYEAGTVGVGAFPSFTPEARDAAGPVSPVNGVYKITGNTIAFRAQGFRLRFYINGQESQPPPQADGFQSVRVDPGTTTLGVGVFAEDANRRDQYIRWVDFSYGKVTTGTPFTGTYSGTSTGTFAEPGEAPFPVQGTFTVTVDEANHMTGSVTDSEGNTLQISGVVDATGHTNFGTAATSNVQATFTGRINASTGAVSGTYTSIDPLGGQGYGTYTGHRN